MKKAKKIPKFLVSGVLYQLFLRPFSREGSLAAAAEMLPHISSLGITVIYLCPVTEADDDKNQEFWTHRMIKSGFDNPRNPYRVKDYFKVDPEYGTDDDLKQFISHAHEYGMKVILDLVYYHCGPSFAKAHPDFVKRDKNGRIKRGLWRFPEIDFESETARNYFWRNMEYFVKEFDADGYRCDCANNVPLDFWEAGRKRLEALKPDIIMLAESQSPEHHAAAFDLSYGYFRGMVYNAYNGASVKAMIRKELIDPLAPFLPGTYPMYAIEHHDFVHDNDRLDNLFPFEAVNGMLVLLFTLGGIPMLYNGQEIADTSMHSIYTDSIHRNGGLSINWRSALTPNGQGRLNLVKKLAGLRHTLPSLYCGSLEFPSHRKENDVFLFLRKAGNSQTLIAVNARNEQHILDIPSPDGDIILGQNVEKAYHSNRLKIVLAPYGYAVIQIQSN